MSGFDPSNLEKAACAGHELIDELEQITDRYPDAADARDEANGDMDMFLAVADLDDEAQSTHVASE